MKSRRRAPALRWLWVAALVMALAGSALATAQEAAALGAGECHGAMIASGMNDAPGGCAGIGHGLACAFHGGGCALSAIVVGAVAATGFRFHQNWTVAQERRLSELRPFPEKHPPRTQL